MADNADARLGLFLDQYYAASIGRGDPAVAEASLRDRIQAEAAFKTAAQARLKSLHPDILKRDHISRVSADILRKVLT